jgi:hypothetical protein
VISSGEKLTSEDRTPGFSNHREPPKAAVPATDTEPEKKAEPVYTWLAQKTAYITNFISKGFPQPNYAKWVLLARRHPNHRTTEWQYGLDEYVNKLQNAQVYVMHPRKYDFKEEGEEGMPDVYEVGEGPQFPDGLELLHKAVNDVMENKVKFLPDYLYIPAREDEARTRSYNTPSGRSLFEYDPKFDLGNGRTTRMGMLLYEDGGEQTGERDDDGNYKPGPGGPFFFDFGITSGDAMDID